MAVPKNKVSKARRNKRRSAVWKLDAPAMSTCSNCGAFKAPHKVCKNCGKVYYNPHAKSEFCGTKCRNYYNVKAFREKQLGHEEASFSSI